MSWHNVHRTNATLFPVPIVRRFEEIIIRRHGASAKEMLGHPVVFTFNFERVGSGAVAENMGE